MQRGDEEVFCRVFPKEPVEHEKRKEKWNESKQVYNHSLEMFLTG